MYHTFVGFDNYLIAERRSGLFYSTDNHVKYLQVVFSEGIARCVHLEVQDFVQRRLRDLLRFSVKRKKQIIKT